MIDTVIFDLDGTLLDTLSDLADSANWAIGQIGLPARSREEVRSFVGNGVALLLERMVGGRAGAGDTERALALFRAHYQENMFVRTAPYPGVMDLLAELRRRGIGCAISSNKFAGAVEAIRARYFDGLIETALGEGADVPKKPDPTGPRRAMEELGGTPSTTLYVGDSDVDMATARNLGVPGVGVSWGFRPRELLVEGGAAFVADSAEELLDYILKEGKP